MSLEETKRNEEALPPPVDLLEGLSPRRREIISPVFETPRDYVLLTVRDLAATLGSDPATTLRIVRAMGFAGYRDFQQYLHQLSLALTTPSDRWRELELDGDVVAQIQHVLRADAANLETLTAQLEVKRLLRLADDLCTAKRILIFAGDLASTLAEYLHYHLVVLGLPSMKAVLPGETEHLARTTAPGDLVFAITFGRGLKQTVEPFRVASENGAQCVGLTDNLVSPLARFSDEIFHSPKASAVIGESYVAPIAFLNALIAACGAVDPDRTRARLARASESQKGGHRWYES